NQAGLKRRNISLLAGGSPCQPFSKSAYWANGAHKGLSDARATTLYAYTKVVEAALPEVFLLENVNGIVSNGQGSKSGLQLLDNAVRAINRREGTHYDLQLIHLDCAEYGVPQFRERLFILANIAGKKLVVPAPTHGEKKGLEPYRTTWDAIGDLDDTTW